MEMEPWDPLDHPARIEVRRQGYLVHLIKYKLLSVLAGVHCIVAIRQY